MKKYLENMVIAYLECALWSSTDETGEPMDRHATIKDFSKIAKEKAEKDCQDFLTKSGDVALTANQLGHNFWLSRNGHGTGFFDMNIPQAQELQELAKTFKECDCYVGDDGSVELM
jgi:hypothetical protein